MKKFWYVINPLVIFTLLSQVAATLGMIIYIVVKALGMGLTGMELSYMAADAILQIQTGDSPSSAIFMASIGNMLMVMMFCVYAISFPILLKIMKNDESRGLDEGWRREYTVTKGRMLVIPALLGISACIAGNGIINIMIAVLRININDSGLTEQMFNGSMPLQILTMAVGAPIVEELLFRGVIQGRLKRYIGVRASVVLSALIFGIYHMIPIQIMYAFMLGLILAFLRERYNSLLAPILTHAAANLLSVVLSAGTLFERLFENVWIMAAIISASIAVTIGMVNYIKNHIKSVPVDFDNSERQTDIL